MEDKEKTLLTEDDGDVDADASELEDGHSGDAPTMNRMEAAVQSPGTVPVDGSSAAPASEIQRSSSWIVFMIVGVVCIALADYALTLAGQARFWNPRNVYLFSLFIRWILLVGALYLLQQRLERSETTDQTVRTVIILTGFLSGLVVAIFRFVAGPAFWSFVNLAVEPLDSALLGFFAVFIMFRFKRSLPLTKNV